MHVLSLDGEWSVSQAGMADWFPAQVPGTIHQDLRAAGKIEDPYYRDNEDRQQWIGEVGWVYRRTFTVPADVLAEERVLLRCHGLDTLATVVLNGTQVAVTENMFRTWEFDVKSLLLPGENTIEITFAPTPDYINARQQERAMPGWHSAREIQGRSWLRKEPCNFGWDWGPVLITCGIWRSLELVGYTTARLTGLHIQQDHTTPGSVLLHVAATVDTLAPAEMEGIFTVHRDGQFVAAAEAAVSGDRAFVVLPISDPQLWWPNGMGDQPLYTVQCALHDAQGQALDRTTRRIGLRTLRLRRQQDTWGESFEFVANGVPFFAKGANWIPADTFAPRVDREQYTYLLRSAAEANMNMLRAWGGGIYEQDEFFDLCDELGLCVWQDFIFACSTYPAFSEAFTQNVMGEVVDNITRLRHHPSIALWCGNNELEMGLVGQEWTTSHMDWDDYTHLFDNILPELVQLLDPERDYWPCSPHSPYGDRADHSNPRWGDAHLWDVWHGKKPFEWYRTCEHRFCSEFGFQSFPEPRTVHAYTRPEERNVTSYIMEHHQRSGIGNSTIMTYLLDWYRLPTDFDMTLWLSQILHGMAMKYAVEHWRRSMPRTMGTLYWQLNDCWPVASWASIDYHGRWKALQYMAKRFNAPLLVSGVEDLTAGTVELHVTSDRREAVAGTVRWQLTDMTGTVLTAGSEAVTIAPLGNTHVTTVDVQAFLAEHGPRALLCWMALEVDGACVSTNFASFARPKHLELAEPELSFTVEDLPEGRLLVTLSAQQPALWAWLTTDTLEVRYSDNFVHLHPAVPARIEVTPLQPTTRDALARDLRAYSLVDTYRPAAALITTAR